MYISRVEMQDAATCGERRFPDVYCTSNMSCRYLYVDFLPNFGNGTSRLLLTLPFYTKKQTQFDKISQTTMHTQLFVFFLIAFILTPLAHTSPTQLGALSTPPPPGKSKHPLPIFLFHSVPLPLPPKLTITQPT